VSACLDPGCLLSFSRVGGIERRVRVRTRDEPIEKEPIVDHSFRVGSIALHGMRARLARGVSWNLVASVFNQGSTFVVNLVLANLWGLQRFGEYAIVLSTLTTLTAIVQPTTGAAAIKYVAELRSHDPERAGRILGLCLWVSLGIAVVAAGVLLIGAHGLADVLHAPGLSAALMIASVVVFASVLSGVLTGALAGLESYPALGKAGMLAGTLYVVVCALGGWAWGLEGAVAGLAVSAVSQCAVLFWFVIAEAAPHGIRINAADAVSELSVLYQFVTPAALNSLIAFPALWAANALLVRQPDGYQQMALFTAANTFRLFVMFLPAILGNVTWSLLNYERGRANARRFSRLFWTNLGIGVGVVVLVGLAVVLGGPWLLGRFGRDFRAGAPVLAVLMLAAVPETLAISVLQVLQARERVWLSFFGMVLPGYGSLVILARLLTPGYGATGLAWSYVAAMGLEFLVAACIILRLGVWERPAVARASG